MLLGAEGGVSEERQAALPAAETCPVPPEDGAGSHG